MNGHVSNISMRNISYMCFMTGARSFGGWSTTAILIEKELKLRSVHDSKELVDNAVAYAQILPGATQVAIISSIGYKLRGFRGALTATICYLMPAVGLMLLFAIIYFHFSANHHTAVKLGGLRAALSGVILANAYRIASRHTTHRILWLVVLSAFVAQLLLNNSLIIILAAISMSLIYAVIIVKRVNHNA